MTGTYMRLDDFDDFIEIAQGCQNVFFQLNRFIENEELIAYAGRVYWKGESQDKKLAELADMRAKQVIETTDQPFR